MENFLFFGEGSINNTPSQAVEAKRFKVDFHNVILIDVDISSFNVHFSILYFMSFYPNQFQYSNKLQF